MITVPDFNEMNDMRKWLEDVPFDVIRYKLYSAEDLYKGYEPSDDAEKDKASFDACYDRQTYMHFLEQGTHPLNVNESLARSIHDHSIFRSLMDFTEDHDVKRCVGIMGGHAMLRTDSMFTMVAMLSKRLTEDGFFMVSGGGPGAMEATHLGAWLAGRPDDEAKQAISQLAQAADSFMDRAWLSSACDLKKRYPQTRYESLAIPTWLYGHEPATPFATHIAKFFDNSVREDAILTMAFGGIIYTPGSAGTLQEIFQDAVQNHYLSYDVSSPMIFLGKHFWMDEVPVYPLMKHLMEKGRYKNLMLTLTDDMNEIGQVLRDFQKSAFGQELK